MRASGRRGRLLALAGATGLWVGLSVPNAASAAPAPAASAASTVPATSGATQKTIVLLKDQEAGLAARSAIRSTALNAEETPLVSEVRHAGAKVEATGRQLPYFIASLTAAQRSALSANPDVQGVFPDVTIPNPMPQIVPEPTVRHAAATTGQSVAVPPSLCGTSAAPEQDPEALSVVHAPEAWALGYDGAGIKTAYMAGPIDTTVPDFQRNAAYASDGSATGSPVVTNINFSGEPAGTPSGDLATESFIDASSIAAQGNTTYDLNTFINSSHTEPSSPCDITVTGTAPGATVTGLDVFSDTNNTTQSNFIQAIDYAVATGVKVLNQSFGANNFPDTALDATRIADDDAVAAGVTVVASTGDAGVTSTIGSPATDPNVISVGASTTFRSYEQNFFGGINAGSLNNGTWINNNISSLSSGGFAMSGANTVDLVAPGDLNWGLCSPSPAFTACNDENGNPSLLQQAGGTSESSPLTAGAAADVIQAYAATHGGVDPSPALVKQILMSTATDISAPAEQQGAGLLNIEAAVKEATSLPGTSATPTSGLVVSPNQINITQNPGATTSRTVSLTNTGASQVTVNLSTRALTHPVADHSGSFCMNPSTTASTGCPVLPTVQIWSGVKESYATQTFTVPDTTSPSRLNFSADYPFDNPSQTSLLHIALFDPSGAYAGYSLPQGLADFANIQVANPVAGTWTAVFFTEQDGATSGAVGTSGTVQWDADTSQFAPAGSISPASLIIAPGATGTATFSATSPAASGDAAQSIVLDSGEGVVNTIPVTVRTLVPTTNTGGNFSGTLTGGNGRNSDAVTNTYAFNVPAGLRDLDVSAAFGDTNDAVVAYLLDPEGEAVANSSSITNNSGTVTPTGAVNVYKDSPQAGQWRLVLEWLQVSGSELSLPFTGTVGFNHVSASSNLPTKPGTVLTAGHTYTFDVKIKNTGTSAQAFFLDPRTTGMTTLRLPDLTFSDQNMPLPLPPSCSGLPCFPLYDVPADTTGIQASLTGTAPVSFDIEPWTGDPDLSPALAAPGQSSSQDPYQPSLSYTSPAGEVMPGIWYLNPSLIGPYPDAGASPASASASFSAVTQAFDSTVNTSTGDLWTTISFGGSFNPDYLTPGQSDTLTVHITPTASPGTLVKGSINLDDFFLFNPVAFNQTSGDELASLPFSYRVAPRATSTTVTSSANPGHTNTTTTLTATVSPTPDGSTVAFTDNGRAIPTCGVRPVNRATGQATCAVNYITTGNHMVRAHYAGDLVFGPSTSAPLVETVNAGPKPKEAAWLAAPDGTVAAFGGANYGSLKGVHLNQPIVAITSTPDGKGYWLVARDGGVFPFGDAHYWGSTGGIHLNQAIVGMAADPATGGYWLVAADGGIFPFHAPYLGSTGNVHLNKPVVGMAATADGMGYWLVASDGGIFPFGDAHYHGSTGNVPLVQPVVGMAADTGTGGYWLVARDGGIFNFAAPFFGSAGASHLTHPVVGMGETGDAQGYWIATSNSSVLHFGDALALARNGAALDQAAVGVASEGPPPNSI